MGHEPDDLEQTLVQFGDVHLQLYLNRRLGMAGRIWDGAFAMLAALEQVGILNASLVDNRVLELGAGTGVCGLACAWFGATVDLTDTRAVLPQLHANISLNAFPHLPTCTDARVRAFELDWSQVYTQHDERAKSYDIVIGSEVAYSPVLYDALLQTLCAHAQSRTRVFISYINFVEEMGECKFWSEASLLFDITKILLSPDQAHGCDVYELIRK